MLMIINFGIAIAQIPLIIHDPTRWLAWVAMIYSFGVGIATAIWECSPANQTKGEAKMPHRNCLNCKYEPEWSEWKNFPDHSRCIGSCKFVNKLDEIVLPACSYIHTDVITRYHDDSGIKYNCPAWEPK